MPLPAAPFLYAVVDAALLGGRDAADLTRALLRGGAALLQVRAKHLADGEFVALARAVVAAARESGVAVLVNDRPDIARIVGADGVHVGQDDLRPEEARQVAGRAALLGVSTHDAAQLERALVSSADYVAVGPVFATATKAAADPPVGLPFVEWAAGRAGTRPIVGIGGIDASNVASVTAAGAAGVAVVGALMRAGDPEAAAQGLTRALRAAR